MIAKPATMRRFVDAIEAVGTANARESVVISANVTERVKALHFHDGQAVKKGQILAELSLSEETADLAEAQARLKEAQLQLERVQQLAERGYATRANLDQRIAERDAAEATMQSIQARIDDRIIRAPFSGIAGLRNVSPGIIVTAGTPLVEISDISTIKLDFTIPEAYLSQVDVGQQVQARVSAFNNQLFTGRITAIDPQVDPVTRSASVRALIDNPDLKLKPGMLMTVGIIREQRDALAVPELAVVGEGREKYVYTVNEDGRTVSRTRVLTGERQPGYVEVTAGLQPGDLVVSEGVVKLRDGSPIKLLKSASNEPKTAERETSRS
ncbi:efflux RND transporter periplasmic adaptor subunit [Pedomonas mirosovicensis]|uniref:efflux RND transporter periplasmic adaptor subunit n=1 Tax=Pedomonas mirosovicensis TaxID=2908641 RepID=UPI00216A5FF0|nr:efflux RND transporter periplasmic adaptor subunit [Pedomonas mirosovicensis]MCH8685444.1 efflux RND transporter periplasmic adaptor subunit [Pedomonas mirosovicensis]